MPHSEGFDVTFNSDSAFDADMTTVVHVLPDPYTGDYTITPTGEAQEIEIKGRTAVENIVVNPIPSNYGMITWNGVQLIVS